MKKLKTKTTVLVAESMAKLIDFVQDFEEDNFVISAMLYQNKLNDLFYANLNYYE